MTTENEKSKAARITEIIKDCLFKDKEIADGKPPSNAIIVEGIVQTMGFHPARIAQNTSKVIELIREVVTDEFLVAENGGGGGMSFLHLCVDRSGEQWGEHRNMEELYLLAAAAGLAGLCAPRAMWEMLPGGMPYLWFRNELPMTESPKPVTDVALALRQGQDPQELEVHTIKQRDC